MVLFIYKGNPWPSVVPKQRDLRNSLVNILLDEARRDYRREKYQQMVEDLEATNGQSEVINKAETIGLKMDEFNTNSTSVPKEGTPM